MFRYTHTRTARSAAAIGWLICNLGVAREGEVAFKPREIPDPRDRSWDLACDHHHGIHRSCETFIKVVNKIVDMCMLPLARRRGGFLKMTLSYCTKYVQY